MSKPRSVNYLIYTLLISIGFGNAVFSAPPYQASPFLGMLLCFAVVVLRWQHFKQPINFKVPEVKDIISTVVALLFLAAATFFFVSIRRDSADVLIKHFWNNRPFLACLWGAMLLAPLREMISTKDSETKRSPNKPIEATPDGAPHG